MNRKFKRTFIDRVKTFIMTFIKKIAVTFDQYYASFLKKVYLYITHAIIFFNKSHTNH